ncbi:MAG: hypothetical protein OES53_07475 [Xanthomonadales bacterium]|mgnify:CR=1 FL=1|jgi:hypothetical protein|nr:hypothetical protein [Xanthomonadales bacterium]MDH3923153.1 hypothetical protein [Xanthomonadales bacterium]MDH4000825.1 hypothetical protein [Xanthomonadales bacterium]
MNNSKILTVGCAVALALAPCSVTAASLQDGLDACADAMVTVLASGSDAPLDYSVSPDSDTSKARLRVRETIHLDARDPASNEVVARADCVVDSRARVKRLVSVPLTEPDAAERAISL